MTASMKTRGRSVPATTSQPEPSCRPSITKPITTAIIPSSTPSSSSSSISPNPANGALAAVRNGTGSSKLFSHADALARMTVELNVRAVSAQTERLEKSLGALVACTKEDKAFRETHDARLQSMCREIFAVKQRMEEIQGPEWKGRAGAAGAGAAAGQKEADESIEQLKREMGELRGWVSDISSALDKLPTAAEAEALMKRTQASASASNGGGTQARPTAGHQKSGTKEARSVKQRIEDTIASTRRWNRDHKTTKLNSAVFIANYLKQQSKRDPQMAVYLQRAIQKHVQSSRGRPRTRARPKNLEQFCKTLVWKDVLDAAEVVLVRDWRRTARALEERA